VEFRYQLSKGSRQSNPWATAQGIDIFWCSCEGGNEMANWDQVEGNWKQFTGRLKQKWGKLTDDDLDVAAGKRDELVGRLQERYGYARERAEREVDEFTRSV
jgi:uncharacterized protein YjbJ (UPF0337 family)